ncbi:MAG: hypothetical protein HFI38_06775 [Lachnospiraceae bacterium]|nr:hypothetical protein [Lachnospiraceae bacterium]
MKEDTVPHTFRYRVYDLEEGTVSELIVPKADTESRIRVACYPGGYRLYRYESLPDGSRRDITVYFGSYFS